MKIMLVRMMKSAAILTVLSLNAVVSYAAPLTDPPASGLSEIARDHYGNILKLTQPSAASYCASRGMRLPSARELAQLSVSMGASISETPKNDYYLESVVNADGKEDRFYFRYVGYKRPAADLGDNYFWSSSIVSNYPDQTAFFNGYNGVIGDTQSFYAAAVVCVDGL